MYRKIILAFAGAVAVLSAWVLFIAARYVGFPRSRANVEDTLLLWSPFPEPNYLLVAFPLLIGVSALALMFLQPRANTATRVFLLLYLSVAAYVLAYEWHAVRILSNEFNFVLVRR